MVVPVLMEVEVAAGVMKDVLFPSSAQGVSPVEDLDFLPFLHHRVLLQALAAAAAVTQTTQMIPKTQMTRTTQHRPKT